MSLRRKAFAALAVLVLATGAVLFGCAGGFSYWQGWLFLAIYWAASIWHTLYLLKNDPALLARRMKGGPAAEKRPAQRVIMRWVTILYIAMFVISGFDHRLAWSHMPEVVVAIGDGMIAFAFFVFHLVLRENSFASATIEISEGQKVISTGPYRMVRHPMYSGGLLFLLGIPIALGSWWAVLTFLPLLPVLIWRIVDEEKLLNKELDGYTEYCTRVKYRLIPGLY
jgi:protein-S-isoprenylcysteine O-methyltransferase Ste14